MASETLVGYTLYGIETASGHWKIFRIMIDAREQGKGYGRAALRAVIADIASDAAATDVHIAFALEISKGERPDELRALLERLSGTDLPNVPTSACLCHGDANLRNFLKTPNSVALVDWEYQ